MFLATILLAMFAATSLMTAFSYFVSESFNKLYKEPLLLQYLMSIWHLELSPNAKMVAGWAIHYGIGLIFVAGYFVLWKWDLYEITWLSGLIFGAIIGIIGIGGWEAMFTLTNHNPKIDFKGYYLQLFFVHIIFGMTAFTIFDLLL